MAKSLFQATNSLLRLALQRHHSRMKLLRHMCATGNQEKRDEHPLYDVIISGGGMVGAAMAGALGYDPMFKEKKILLLEGGPEKSMAQLPDVYSSRTCALSPATRNLFEDFGAWDEILKMRYQPVSKMQVWDSCSDAMISFQNDDLLDDLAYIVENDVILEAVMRAVKSCGENMEVRYGARAKAYSLPKVDGGSERSPWSQVHLEDGATLNARLLIGADGFKSLVRQSANINTVGWDYNQFGVVATVTLSEPTENNIAWQRFLPTGPVALLPLSPEHSCLIWSTTPEEAKNLLRMEPDNFVDAVNNAFWSDELKSPIADYTGKILDNILVQVGLEGSSSQQLPPTIVSADTNSKAAFPLGVGHANQYVKHRMALIGDAAHRIHPMAGQGVNLGFGDVTCLRDKLSDAVYNGEDIGAVDHLLEYESERQLHVVPTLAGVDGLQRLYGTDWTPAVLLRSLGLQATNALPSVKEMFLRHATK